VKLHHVGVGVRQRQRRSDAPRRTDRAEQIGVVVALVGGLARPCSAPGPLSNLTVLLADASLVLKPDFDRRRLGQVLKVSLQSAREGFFESLDDPLILRRMARPGAQSWLRAAEEEGRGVSFGLSLGK
jgi:hypothetical protein